MHQIEILVQPSGELIFDSLNRGLNSEYLSETHNGFYLQTKPSRVIFKPDAGVADWTGLVYIRASVYSKNTSSNLGSDLL